MKPDGRDRKRDWLKPSKWLEIYTLWAYKRPLLTFCFFAGVLILFTIIAGAANSMKLSDTEGDEWLLKTNEHTKRDQAIEEALDELASEIDQNPRSVDEATNKMMITYKAKDDSRNMFTEANIETMRKIENAVLQHEKYKDFCQLNYTDPEQPCMKTLSPLHFFFTYNVTSPMFGNPTGTIEDGLAALSKDSFRNGFFVTEAFNETGEKSLYTRSQFSFGLPVPPFKNSNEEEDEQREIVYKEFLEDLESELWELLGMDNPTLFRTEYSKVGKLDSVEVVYHHMEIENEEFNRAVIWDFLWAGLSILSVWVYMLIHLGSFFLSLVGIFEIFMAFPITLVFYREIFSVDYFSHLNILIIFVLLGIGADDIFVFTDAFKQSHYVAGVGANLKDRLSYTAQRASKAVFVTSFTTTAAFFATAISDLMPMQAFGIFAGLSIIFLFLINIVLMPPAMVLWAGYTPWCVQHCCCCCNPLHGHAGLKKSCPCCTCCHINEYQGFEMPSGDPRDPEERQGGSQAIQGAFDGSAYATQSAQQPGEQHMSAGKDEKMAMVMSGVVQTENVAKMRNLEKFFNGPFFNFVKRARIIIIIVGAVLFGVGLFFITKFEAPEEAEEWWPPEHMFHKHHDLSGRDGPFLADDADTFATVHLVWGLEGMDTSGRNIWDAEDFGKLVYDTTFDMTSTEAQRHLLGVCGQARNARCSAKECQGGFLVRFDRNVEDSFKRCWIEDFNQTLAEGEFPDGLPIPPEDFIRVLSEFRNNPETNPEYQEQIGLFNDTELRFIQFELDSTFRPPTAFGPTEDVLDVWEEFMDGINKQAKAVNAIGVSKGYQSGRLAFVWLWTQKGLVDNAKQGVGIIFALAFIVLNIATGNVIITCIAIITVAGIVTTVMGIGISWIMGWDLGVAESIISVILIGFSMDYTLHLSDSYIESERTTRMDRTQDALTHLGISVTAGAITTLVSGLFLWGAILTFFTKFAFNITATILASYLWSMLFFPAMAMTFGPEGNYGNWSTMFFCCQKSDGDGTNGKKPQRLQEMTPQEVA